MAPHLFSYGIIAAVVALMASAANAATFDQYCERAGFLHAQRQTVIVIDEREVEPEAGDATASKNMGWRKFLGRLLLGDNTVLDRDFEPREHVALLIARKDGTGLHTVFEGCLPFYSVAEQREIAAKAGYMNSISSFFGAGPIADAKKDLEMFRITLGTSVKDALNAEALSKRTMQGRTLADSGLVTSLKQSGVSNPAYGVPRIILYSDLSRYFGNAFNSGATGRRAGIAAGKDAGLDLSDAEIYLVGPTESSSAREALNMFFLASHAELVSSNPGDVLPRFTSAPMHVARYQGFIVYPDNKFPIRIRLATDRDGTVVDSWLTVRTSKMQFAPIHGVVTCETGKPCVFTGDDQFAQIWNPDRSPSGDPNFSADLPFAGARTLQFRFDGGNIKGSISDPQIRFQGVRGYTLEFSGSRQANATF